MAQSLIDKIRTETQKGYKWGESDCISMLETAYEHKFNYVRGMISFRISWLHYSHARVIALAKRNFGNLQNAYISCLESLNFRELTKPNDTCAYVTKERTILYLRDLDDPERRYRLDLTQWHGAILGVYIKEGDNIYHLTYQADGLYVIQNHSSVKYYFEHRLCL